MIDIIITAYNSQHLIKKALDSILKQTALDKILVTIVNNGSKENYHDIIDKYANKMHIQELTIKKNHGPGPGRQFGIDKTNNKYIMFIDSDDELGDINIISKMFKLMEENNNINRVSGNVQGYGEIFHTHLMQHGNLYRRSFLEKYNIKFKKSFNLEDLRFGYIVEFMLNEDEIMLIDDLAYIYNYERNVESYSIKQRSVPKYIKCAIDGYEDAIKFAKKYHKESRGYSYSLELFSLLADTYNRAKKEHAFADEYVYSIFLKRIYKFYLQYKNYIYSAIKDEKDRIWVNNFGQLLEENCA